MTSLVTIKTELYNQFTLDSDFEGIPDDQLLANCRVDVVDFAQSHLHFYNSCVQQANMMKICYKQLENIFERTQTFKLEEQPIGSESHARGHMILPCKLEETIKVGETCRGHHFARNIALAQNDITFLPRRGRCKTISSVNHFNSLIDSQLPPLL